MPNCSICSEEIPVGSRTCSVCGTSVDYQLPMGTILPGAEPAPAVLLMPAELPPGGSYCPVCIRVYGREHTDGFCSCGTELLRELPAATELDDVPMAPFLDDEPSPAMGNAAGYTPGMPSAAILDELPMAPVLEDTPPLPTDNGPWRGQDASSAGQRIVKPAAGTPCLVLYGADKQPLQYFALTKDTMLIGRLDAVVGNFPDIDLDEWFDRVTIRKISRQHALILRSRATQTFTLRPLLGNTGTQLEGVMVAPQQDYPLKPGRRIILGGVIRLKFEIA